MIWRGNWGECLFSNSISLSEGRQAIRHEASFTRLWIIPMAWHVVQMRWTCVACTQKLAKVVIRSCILTIHGKTRGGGSSKLFITSNVLKLADKWVSWHPFVVLAFVICISFLYTMSLINTVAHHVWSIVYHEGLRILTVTNGIDEGLMLAFKLLMLGESRWFIESHRIL